MTRKEVIEQAQALEYSIHQLHNTAIKVIRFWEANDHVHRIAGVGYKEYVDLFEYGKLKNSNNGYNLVVIVSEDFRCEYTIPWLAVENFEVYKSQWLVEHEANRKRQQQKQEENERIQKDLRRAEYERLKKEFEPEEKSA